MFASIVSLNRSVSCWTEPTRRRRSTVRRLRRSTPSIVTRPCCGSKNREKAAHRRLAASRAADDGHHAPPFDLEARVAHRVMVGRVVAERDVLEADPVVERRLGLRRRILRQAHVDVHQRPDSLQRRLGRLDLDLEVRHLLDRLVDEQERRDHRQDVRQRHVRGEAPDEEAAEDEDADRLDHRPDQETAPNGPHDRAEQTPADAFETLVLVFFRAVRLDDPDARQDLVDAAADDGPLLQRPPTPLPDPLADEDDRHHERRQPDDDDAQGRQHVVLDGEPDDESDRDENLERRARELGQHPLDDGLHRRRVARRPPEQLPDVDPPVELERLFVDLAHDVDAQVRHRARRRPRETVLVEEDEKKPRAREKRDDDDGDEQKRPAHRPAFVLKRDAAPPRQSLDLRIPPRQLRLRREVAGEPLRHVRLLNGRRTPGFGADGVPLLGGDLLLERLDALVATHALERRLDDLEKRHERSRRQHAADEPHEDAQLVLPRVRPHAGIRLAHRIVAVEELFFVLRPHVRLHSPCVSRIAAMRTSEDPRDAA